MQDDGGRDDLGDTHLFDGDDVDAGGPPAPDGTALTPAEIEAVRAARAGTAPNAQAG